MAYSAFRASQVSKLTSIFTAWRSSRPVNILNPTLCKKALDNLDLSSYKNSILIDMNPGVSIWSAALHDKIKPRQHILFEPETKYKPYLDAFVEERPNAYWVPLDAYQWDTYFKLFTPDPPSPPWPQNAPAFDAKYVPPEEGINTDLIFTGNLSSPSIHSDRLLAQFLSACAHKRWVQKFGRVRFLVWTQDLMKVRYVPRGIGGRVRATLIADTLCDVQEVASSNEVSIGKGYPRVAQLTKDADGKTIVVKSSYDPHAGVRNPRQKGSAVGKKGGIIKEPVDILQGLEERIDKFEKEYRDGLHVYTGKRKPIRNPGDPGKWVATARMKARDYPAASPEVERLRQRVMKLQDEIGVRPLSTDELPTIMRGLNQFDRSKSKTREKLINQLAHHFSEPEESGKWLAGMEHPPWYYKDRISDLADKIVALRSIPTPEGKRPGGNHVRVVNPLDALGRLKALERPEEVEPPKTTVDSEVSKKLYESFDEQWGRKTDEFLLTQSLEDEVIAFDKKMLQFHTRKFDPVTVDDNDFWPSTPLALLDFTPKTLPPFLNDPDPAVRANHWETFNWMLCSLFTLRAHTIGSALSSLVPGGVHILDNIDPQDAQVHAAQRIRTLTTDELVAVTKAWETWPFKTEGAHLEQFMGDEVDKDRGGKPRIMSIKLGGSV